MTRVTVLYFASLRDAAGCASETIETSDRTLRALYTSLSSRHHFGLSSERLRVAVDGAFSNWDVEPHEGAEIAFIPPVSGG